MKTLLVIPAYNEEGSLERTVKSVQNELPEMDFLIINDGSTDNTANICRRNNYPFLDLDTNLGLAGGFQAGVKYALRHDYDCVVQFDADGQHLPQYVRKLVDATKDANIAIGSRFIDGKMKPSMRSLGSSLIRGSIKLTTGKTITDPTSGMRAFDRSMIELLASGLNMGPEPDTISYLIRKYDAKVVEVAVTMAERTEGESYLNPWTSSKYMMRMAVSILLMQFFRK